MGEIGLIAPPMDFIPSLVPDKSWNDFSFWCCTWSRIEKSGIIIIVLISACLHVKHKWIGESDAQFIVA